MFKAKSRFQNLIINSNLFTLLFQIKQRKKKKNLKGQKVALTNCLYISTYSNKHQIQDVESDALCSGKRILWKQTLIEQTDKCRLVCSTAFYNQRLKSFRQCCNKPWMNKELTTIISAAQQVSVWTGHRQN